MTLNGVMALALRYFTKLGIPAFQLLTASSGIELIDQKSASITQNGAVSVRNEIHVFARGHGHTNLLVSLDFTYF